MKKLFFLFSGLLFISGLEAIAGECSASYDCSSTTSISCTGDKTCDSGHGWVECTFNDGGRAFNACSEILS